MLTVGKEMVQTKPRRQLRLAVLLWYLLVKILIGPDQLAVLVRLQRAVKQVNGIRLPLQELKGLSGPLALGVAEQAEKGLDSLAILQIKLAHPDPTLLGGKASSLARSSSSSSGACGITS